jgi:exonuclease III
LDIGGSNDKRPGTKKEKRFGIHEILNVAAWNVRSVGNKESELVEEIKTKCINIAVISKTRKKLKGTKIIGNYSMLYSEVSQETRVQSGVAFIIDHKWTSRIVNYSFVNDRVITVRLKTNRGHITVTGVYTPEEGREEETRRFYKQLQKEVDKYSNSHSLIISGDLNARVGNQPMPNVVGTFGEDCKNRNGQTLREFASFNDFKTANIFFRKKEIYKYTWSARGSKCTIDYIIVNRRLKNLVQDIKIFRGSDIGSDHFLATSRINLLSRWKQQSNNSKLVNELVNKIYLLQEEGILRLYQQRLAKNLSEYHRASTID